MTEALTNTILTIPQPGQFELVERPYPTIAAGYAIIKTEIAPVCLEGSRIWAAHDFEFHDDAEHLGHEGVGTVVEVMNGSNFQVGDRVIVFQGDHCGHCHACTQGLSPTYCDANDPDLRGVDGSAMKGIEKRTASASGGFAMATYRIAPEANMFRIPDELQFRHAASANCSLGVGFSNQEVMNVKAGDTVLVGGVGFIAMGHIISALYRNATVIALMRNEYREGLLREMGVQHFINPDDPDWLAQVRTLTYNGQGVATSISVATLPVQKSTLAPYIMLSIRHTPYGDSMMFVCWTDSVLCGHFVTVKCNAWSMSWSPTNSLCPAPAKPLIFR